MPNKKKSVKKSIIFKFQYRQTDRHATVNISDVNKNTAEVNKTT